MSVVAVVGASDNPDRIAFQAMQRLLQHHHTVIPVSPKGGEILGQPVYTSLEQIHDPVETVTLYVGPERQPDVIDALVALKPKRVIFNPGTENPTLYPRLREAGIAVEEACTLVLLSTNQFDLPV
jgi:predicted CoA-binding protein